MIIKSPLVSVIIPVYNAQATIDKCVASILNQTYQNYEVILINDGSTDGSLALLRQYEQAYEFIHVWNKENTGASDTRNQGIAVARGTYLVFIDSDDYIDNDYIETLVSNIEREELDMVISGIRKVDANGKEVGKMTLGSSAWAKYIITSPCTRIIRKSFLLENQLSFISYTMEDIHFNALAFAKTTRVKTIAYVGYNNFVNPISTTRTLHRGIRPEVDILYILEAIRQEVPVDAYLKFFYRKVALYYLLHTGKHSSPKIFMDEYHRIERWFNKHQLQNSMFPFDKRLADEVWTTRMIMVIFQVIERLNLLPLFAKLYCQGQ